MARTFAINFAIPAMFEPGNVSVRNVGDFQRSTNLPEAGLRRSRLRRSRLDKKRGLVCSVRVRDVGHIDRQREFGAVCLHLRQAKSEAAPATVGGESFFDRPLGFLGKAREGEEGS
jgi:methyl coenzyme M reductase gamma subunit